MTTTDPARPGAAAPATGAGHAGTGTRGTRLVGIATIVTMGWLVAFGLGFSPKERDQGESVRLLYMHVPTIWIDREGSRLRAAADAKKMAASTLRLWLHHRVIPVETEGERDPSAAAAPATDEPDTQEEDRRAAA